MASRFFGKSRRNSADGSAAPQRRRSSITEVFTGSRRRSSSGAGNGDAVTASHHVNQWVDVEGHGIGRIVAFHKAALSRMPGIHDKYDVDFTLGGQHKLLKLHLKKQPRGAGGDGDAAEDEHPRESAAETGEDGTAESSQRKRRSTFSGLQYSICPPAVAASWQSALDMGFTSKADHDACVEMGFISRSRYEHCLGMGFTKKEDYDECFRLGFDDRLEFEESKDLGLTSKEAYVAWREARVRQQKLENSRRDLEKQRAAAIASAEGEGEGGDSVERDLENMRRAFDGIIKKWTLKEVAAAWRRWIDAVETARHAIGFIKKWTLKEVAAAWRRWRRAIQLSRIATGILKKWHNRRVVAAWRQWWIFIDFTRITERILAKWQNRRVAGAWRHWSAVIEDLRKEEAERALVERVQALEKAAAKMTAKLKEKEEALQRSERQLAREVAARKKLDGERAKLRKRKKDVEARQKGYASWEDYESCREMGFTTIEERDEFIRLGFQVKSEYDDFVEMGFRGLSREAFDESLSLGFEHRQDYEAFKNSEFAEKAAYDECKKMGFASKKEYDHCKEIGCHSKSEYDKCMAIRSARIKVRRLHRKHPTEFASGHYCMLRDIQLSAFGEGYDPHGPAPEVVLEGMSEPIVVGKAKVSTRVRWEHPSTPEAVQVGCRVRLSDGREAEVTNVRKWSFSCDVTMAKSEAKTQLVRCDDLEIAVVGSLRSIEFDRQILTMLFPAQATALGEWQPPSFVVVGACSKAASVLAIPWTPIVNCLHDGRVSVIETSKSVASGKHRVHFEGTVHGFSEDSGLYHFRSDGDDLDATQKDFEPQADGVGEVVSTEPSARYQIGTKLLVYRSASNGGRWIPAEITQMDTEDSGRPLHEMELAESLSGGSPTCQRIDLNCANHGPCISTNNGEWDFESSIEPFFGKLSSKYGSLEDPITGGKVQLRDLAAARFSTSTAAGDINDVRVLAREMLDTERSETGGLCHRQVILTGNRKTLASLQLVLEIIDLQRHQRSPPPDIPLYVSVQRLSRGVNAPKLLSLSKYFESDDFTVEEGLLLRQALELRRLIIVLDGIDEAAGRFNTTVRLAEALALAGHRCVVTTRVESLKDTSAQKHLLASSHFSQLDLIPMAEEDRWIMVDQQVLQLAQAKGALLKSMKLLRGATGVDDPQSSSVVENFYGDKAADGKLELLMEVAQDPTLMSMMIAGLQNGNAKGRWAPSSIGHLHEAAVNAVLSKEPKGNGRTYRLLKELATKAHLQRKGEFNASMLSGDCLRALGAAWKSAGKALPFLSIVVAPARDSSVNGGVFKFKQLALQEYLAAKQFSEDLLTRGNEGGVPRGIAVDKVWGKTEEVLALLNDDWYVRMMRLAFEELGGSLGLLFDVLSSALTTDSAINLGNGRLKSWAVFPTLFRSNQTVLSLNLSKCADLGQSLGDGGLREIMEVLESTVVAEIDLSGSDIAGDVVVLEEFKSLAGRLRTLSMQGCSGITGDIRVFTHFPVIQSLVLYDTACYGDVKVFAATPALEKLWLSGTSCSGSIQIFHGLKHLRVLGLQETECEGSEPEIRAALPRCSITFTLMPNGTRALPLFSPAKLKSGCISSRKLPPDDRTSPWLAREAATSAVKSAVKSAAKSAQGRDPSSSESEVVAAAARRRLQF